MKLPGISEQRRFILSRELANEFEAVYDFKEKISRVPLSNVTAIIDKFNVEPEIAKVIYLLELDGKLTGEDAYQFILWIRKRFEEKGHTIPKISTYILNFAAREGTWLYFLYGKFPRLIDDKTRELTNLELDIMQKTEYPTEKIVSLVNGRNTIIETFIAPLIQKWMHEHEDFKLTDTVFALLAPLLNVMPDAVKPYFRQAHIDTRRFFLKLDLLLENDDLIEEGIITKKSILDIRKSLLQDPNEMDLPIISQIFLNCIPKRKIESANGTASPLLIVSSPITRNGLVGPILKSPYDFLERDIRIAKRREKTDRRNYLKTKIQKVYNSLSEHLRDPLKIAVRIIINMLKRFNKKSISETNLEVLLYKNYFGEHKFKEIYSTISEKLKTQLNKTRIPKKDILERIKIKYSIPKNDIIEILTDYFIANF
ncbi:MAG: hypothetical protein ACTSQY_06540 [Candidatus Odinarchaeia archaeon]